MTLEQRFLAKVEQQPNDCWLWGGAKHSGGYGIFWFTLTRGHQERAYAHRWSYEHFNGPIPDGLTIDHVCHNRDEACPGGITCKHRLCVNPEHLAAVTVAVNVLRGKSSSAHRARMTHCRRGHPLFGTNLRIDPKTGFRSCKVCIAIYRKQRPEVAAAASRRYRERNRELYAAAARRSRARQRAKRAGAVVG